MKPTYEPGSHAGRGGRRTQRPKKRSDWMEVLLFYLLPFLVINGILFTLVAARPHITIQVADTRDYRTTTAAITVTSLLPVREFSSSQEGSPLELTEEKKGHYTAQITRNGVIEIYAKGINGMTDTKYEHVNILDDVAPLVGDQYSIQDGILTLTLEDSQSGLDWMSVYGVTASGLSISPASVDKQTGTFTFEMNEDSLIVCASDLAGNPMQATFSTHMEILDPNGVPAASEISETAEADNPDSQTASDETDPAAAGTQAPQQQTPESQAETQAQTAVIPTGSETQAAAESAETGGEVSIYINTTTP